MKRWVIEYVVFFVLTIIIGISSGIDSTIGAALAFIVPVVGIVVIEIFISIPERVKAKAAQKEAEILRKEKESRIAAGDWDFPVEKFYDQCVAAKAVPLKSAFAEQKAIALARQILKEADIPDEYQDLYCSKARIEQYFQEAKRLKEEAKKKKKRPRIAAVQKCINPTRGGYAKSREMRSLWHQKLNLSMESRRVSLCWMML